MSAPGTQLMAIVPDKMWVTANFKETQLQHMRIGQPVTIKVDAYPDVEVQRPCRFDPARRGPGVRAAAAAERDRQLREGRAARAGADRVRSRSNGPDPRKYPIGPGMSVVPTVKVR